MGCRVSRTLDRKHTRNALGLAIFRLGESGGTAILYPVFERHCLAIDPSLMLAFVVLTLGDL
jgi:hypothetical protein